MRVAIVDSNYVWKKLYKYIFVFASFGRKIGVPKPDSEGEESIIFKKRILNISRTTSRRLILVEEKRR